MTAPMREERYLIPRKNVRRGVTAALYTLSFIGLWRSSAFGFAVPIFVATFLDSPVPEWGRPVPRKEATYVAISIGILLSVALGITLLNDRLHPSPAIAQTLGLVVHHPLFVVPLWAFVMWIMFLRPRRALSVPAASGGQPQPGS